MSNVRFYLLMTAVAIFFLLTASHYNKRSNQCHDKGGILVKSGFGYSCVKEIEEK